MPPICYVNGAFVEADQAKVSAFDHGFLYGDGIFESMTTNGGRIFKLRDHLDRLERSARALRLDLPESKERIGEIQMALFNPAHQWYSFPEMTMDEALLSKTFDSAADGRTRCTLHTAFEDPATPADAPPRESIETRCLVLF